MKQKPIVRAADTKAGDAKSGGGKSSIGGAGPAQLNSPFSRMVIVDPMPDEGFGTSIEATEEERAALAALDGLPGIGRLGASFKVTRKPQGGVNVRGQVTGLVTQTCVVSLEPFESEISEEVDVDFMRPDGIAKMERERAKSREPSNPEENEVDPPDAIIDGKIDLGALASEFLALALHPYPKKPGVAFDEGATEKPDERESPFAALRNWDKTS